jgi:hypothetical protein
MRELLIIKRNNKEKLIFFITYRENTRQILKSNIIYCS